MSLRGLAIKVKAVAATHRRREVMTEPNVFITAVLLDERGRAIEQA